MGLNEQGHGQGHGQEITKRMVLLEGKKDRSYI